ncbi:MAG: DUF4115 domain-containing protein [Cypionkella sp.]|nr:DUF4115 domain-containing protein [Cypionkella sp.]
MLGRFGADPDQIPAKPKGFDDYELRLGDMLRGERATMGKSLLDIERELRIKAPHLAAIEDGDLSAFDAPSFIAGYVRSYARYLGLNPDDCFIQFCAETGFVPAHGLSPAASTAAVVAVRAKAAANGSAAFNPIGLTAPRSGFGGFEPGALGSLAVLLAVVGGLSFGGYTLLREVQKVELAPIDQAPAIVADAPPALGLPSGAAEAGLDPVQLAGTAPKLARPAANMDERAARAAQPQALDVPVLIARDGPISAIDPRDAGLIAEAAPEASVQVVQEARVVEVLAVRPSWISVTAVDGTVLFEKILDAGERYAVPALEVAPRLKAGNSSAIYFVLGDKTYGPAATGPEVVRNVDLSNEGVQKAFALADMARDADLTSFVAQASTP